MNEFGSFGTWLKHRRRELDLTQAELARRAGCSKAAVRKIEAGERKPSLQLAGLLARELHISEDEKEAFIQYARNILPEAGSSLSFTAGSKMPMVLPPEASTNNLPAFLTFLIDRTQDIAEVNELITGDEARWV